MQSQGKADSKQQSLLDLAKLVITEFYNSANTGHTPVTDNTTLLQQNCQLLLWFQLIKSSRRGRLTLGLSKSNEWDRDENKAVA